MCSTGVSSLVDIKYGREILGIAKAFYLNTHFSRVRNMATLTRRATIGAIAGIVASAPLFAALGHVSGILMLDAVVGAGYAVLTGPTPGAYLDNILTAGAYGVPLWAAVLSRCRS
jgi:hypothetical protein